MFENFPLQFERPVWLLLLLLIVPVVLLARRSGLGIRLPGISPTGGTISRGKAWTALLLRCALIALLAISVSQPTLVKRGQGLSLTIIADRSASIPQNLRDSSEKFLRGLTETKRPDDRVGVIVVGADAEILSRPERDAIVPALSFMGDTTATDLGAALQIALSMAPRDTSNRVLLVSDGNENRGNLLKEAEAAAANGIPIDVVVLEYEYPGEIVFESIQSPARTRIGATQNVRLFVRSQSATRARLTLRENGRPVDLDPESPGDSMQIDLVAGPNVVEVPISFDEGGAQRFEATIEPLDAGADVVKENNVGTAVTFVAGGGKVLVLDTASEESATLVKALREGGLSVDVLTPDQLVDAATTLNGYDAVILANVPKWSIDPATDRALRSSVHDMGIGFMMLGGPESFGAGGWTDSEVEKMLPVKLDPPASRQLVRGALALIVHACEFPTANYWAQQVSIASIKALSRLDLVGIITFAGMGGNGWHFPLQEAGDKSGPYAAVKSMMVGDMSDFESAVLTAYNGLVKTSAGQKHVIIISDGDPAPPTQATLQKMKDAKITITTVMLTGGLGHGTATDYQNMKYVAQFTGGTFHDVKNPKQLPQIFTKEATIVTRSLISEGDYKPQVVVSLSGPLKGVSAVPGVKGYIVTVPREGLSQTSIVIPSKEGNDPLFAWWNYGVGRSVAFTSDATSRWGQSWIAWPDYRAFWEQTVRWLMRPPSPSNIALRTRVEGETAVVELEAIGEDNAFINFLKSEATVLDPDGNSRPLELQQIGPGRYRAEFPAAETGGYLVNVTVPMQRDGQTVTSSVQAAVNVAYPKEYQTVRDNAALLNRVAELTRGRVLTIGDPKLAGAFDRQGLPVPRSAKRVWDLVAIIAAAIFLADVAVRRLSIERGLTKRIAERLLGRTEKVGDTTVAAWKTARKKAEGKNEPRADAGTPEERKMRADASRAAAGTRFDDEEAGSVGSSMDVAAETRGDGKPRVPRGGSSGSSGSAGDAQSSTAPEADNASTARLLKAKRRARSETGGDADRDRGPSGGPDGGDSGEANRG